MGPATLVIDSATLLGNRCEFPFEVNFTGRLDHRGKLDVSGCVFRGTVTLTPSNGCAPRYMNFTGSTFHRSIEASGPLPQGTTFARIKVEPTGVTPENESRFRSIRKFLADNRAREDEGVFYALEKSCHRKSLHWFSPARFVSKMYDCGSNYGRSYEKALVWFVILQLLFAGLYWLCLDESPMGTRINWDVVNFTLAQIAKPFEPFSARYDIAQNSGVIAAGIWKPITAIHSVLSLTLVALFLLALRWRFRRE